MKKKTGHVQRQGQIYRFVIGETEYAAFVWQSGTRFCGRIQGNPQVPEQTAQTSLAVRDLLKQWLVADSKST